MGSLMPSQVSEDNDDEAETAALNNRELVHEKDSTEGRAENLKWSPWRWFRMLADEMHWSFVFGVTSTYGISQGLGGAISRIAVDYYWKDVQKVQPSAAQFYQGIIAIPWMVKPLWGLLTDVLPMAGYRRRPYFIIAGLLGIIAMLILALHSELHVIFALLALTAGSLGVAVADVTIDACVAENSISHPSLAADMQTLCGFSKSVGGLLGFSVSGVLIHAIGSQGVLGLLSLPSAFIFSVGVLLKEIHIPNFNYGQVGQKFQQASKTMWKTLKCPDVWRPCLYMYTSLALSLNIQEGLFYYYTDTASGLAFSQESIGFIYAVGSVGSLLGVLLYQNTLKHYPFRSLLFWSQLFFGLSGMLDLILVLRLNLNFGVPDLFFAVIDESVTQIVGRIKWMPLLVLSSKLCPPGIEGTFFALLMSIDNVGILTSTWIGGLLLHILKITRTEFGNLWAAVLIINIMRELPLALLFLVPRSDQHSTLLPAEMLTENESKNIEVTEQKADDIEMVSLVEKTS